jgi:hypothetical protein
MVYCAPCNRVFVNDKSYNDHITTSTKHTLNCVLCPHSVPIITPNSLEIYSNHLRDAHKCCIPCGRHFVDDVAYNNHMETSKQHTWHCPHCSVISKTAEKQRDHLREVHAYCALCKRSFIDEKALTAHRENSSRHIDEFRCVECDREFASLRALEDHFKDKVHQKVERIVVCDNYCVLCERQFVNEQAYEMHMNSTKHKPLCEELSCKHCKTTFTAVSAMLQHMESGGCHRPHMSRELVDGIMQRMDTAGVIVDSGMQEMPCVENLRIGSDPESDETTSDVGSDESDGGVIFTPCSTPGVLTPAVFTQSIQDASRTRIPKSPLCCPLCPERGPFIDMLAKDQHLASPKHAPKIYHCPVALGGGEPEVRFSTFSGMLQHVEAGACKGGKETFNRLVKFTLRASGLGIGKVKLIRQLNDEEKAMK